MKVLISIACLIFIQFQTKAQSGSSMNTSKSLSALSPGKKIPGKIPALQMNKYPLYSQPANGIFSLLMEGDYGYLTRIELYNVVGKCLFNSQIHTFRSKLTGLANGVYFVRLFAEDQIITRKIALDEVNADLNRYALVDLK